jgi:predicted nucleotide-binding protein
MNKKKTPQDKALKLVDQRISQFQQILVKATYQNRYDENYEEVYYGTEALLTNLFSKEEAMEFRRNVTPPLVAVGGRVDYAKELQDYKEHVNSCIAQLKVYKDRIENFWETDEEETSAPPATKRRNKVFIVHGRDKTPALELARFVEKRYPLDAILLEEHPHRGRTLIEKLEHYSDVTYAFIVLTPDDVGALRGEPLEERGRQNVIFEWGQFIGKIGRKNVCVLVKGDLEIPSDLKGIGEYRFTRDIKECFIDIEDELREAKLI